MVESLQKQAPLKANKGKKIPIAVDREEWLRFPIKTHLVTDQDNMAALISRYVLPVIEPTDYLFISERIVAITQGRAYPIDTIKPSPLAKMLVKYVHKSPYGIGLGSPVTMQLAIKEAGILPIMAGAVAAAVTKPFGIKGAFYVAVGKNINAIDGPCDYTLPPYNRYAKLGPAKPNQVAKSISRQVKGKVVIIDANDLGVNVLGKSDPTISETFCRQVFRDNPLGQTDEQTPLCLVRPSPLG
jgi:F420-0:gamma-glutamyl ligase-like protein